MLIQHRDPDYPLRVREYLRIGARYSPSLAHKLREPHWGDVDVSEAAVWHVSRSVTLSPADRLRLLATSSSARAKALP